MAKPWYADAESLRASGFVGFSTIKQLRDCKLDCVPGHPGDIGVYVVLRPEGGTPTFLMQSTGGRFKGKDPNVDHNRLVERWLPKSTIIYIGKAGSPGGSATLRSRLRQFLDFGIGKPIGHWGGRYTWHLPASEDLVVCWKLTPERDPRDVEREMIEDFAMEFGSRPFANLVG